MKPLAARGPAGRLTRFWGGEEQNHNDNAQAHHESKDKPSEIVSHKHHPPLLGICERFVGQPPLCNSAFLASPFGSARLSYPMRRVLSIPAALPGGFFVSSHDNPPPQAVQDHFAVFVHKLASGHLLWHTIVNDNTPIAALSSIRPISRSSRIFFPTGRGIK